MAGPRPEHRPSVVNLRAHFVRCHTFASIFVSSSSTSLPGQARTGYDMTCLPACLCSHPSTRRPSTGRQPQSRRVGRTYQLCNPGQVTSSEYVSSSVKWKHYFLQRIQCDDRERTWQKLWAFGDGLLNLNLEFCSKVSPSIILETTFLVNKKDINFQRGSKK